MALSDCLPLGLHCGNWKWLPGELHVIFLCEFCTLQPKFIKKILLLGEGIFFPLDIIFTEKFRSKIIHFFSFTVKMMSLVIFPA